MLSKTPFLIPINAREIATLDDTSDIYVLLALIVTTKRANERGVWTSPDNEVNVDCTFTLSLKTV